MLPIRQFLEAGLDLKQAETPFGGAGNSHVFGLDIEGDHFRMWKPDHVTAQVQARDEKMRQVVMMVKEPEALFTVEIPKFQKQGRDRVIRTFRRNHTEWLEVERKTPAETRHFLCGVDERHHPFIAQLSQHARSVREAHELLKPPEVRGLPIKGHGKNSKVRVRNKKAVIRQGEWFMIPLNQEERSKVEAHAKKVGVRKNTRLGVPMSDGRGIAATRGKPHTADEVVWLTKPGEAVATLYMRGRLRHVEHDTLDFPEWVKVVRNREAGGATAGATWVD